MGFSMDFNGCRFSELCDYYCFLEHELVDLLGIDRRTLRAWQAKNSAPVSARKLIVIVGRGYLPPDGAWSGFKVSGNELITPNRSQRVTPEIINEWFYKDQLLGAYKASVGELRRNNKALSSRLCSANNSIFNVSGGLRKTGFLD